MIDHSYSIITRKVPQANSRTLSFAAKLGELRIVVDEMRIDHRYPNRECFGHTQVEAMISASDALRAWLITEHFQGSLASRSTDDTPDESV